MRTAEAYLQRVRMPRQQAIFYCSLWAKDLRETGWHMAMALGMLSYGARQPPERQGEIILAALDHVRDAYVVWVTAPARYPYDPVLRELAPCRWDAVAVAVKSPPAEAQLFAAPSSRQTAMSLATAAEVASKNLITGINAALNIATRDTIDETNLRTLEIATSEIFRAYEMVLSECGYNGQPASLHKAVFGKDPEAVAKACAELNEKASKEYRGFVIPLFTPTRPR